MYGSVFSFKGSELNVFFYFFIFFTICSTRYLFSLIHSPICYSSIGFFRLFINLLVRQLVSQLTSFHIPRLSVYPTACLCNPWYFVLVGISYLYSYIFYSVSIEIGIEIKKIKTIDRGMCRICSVEIKLPFICTAYLPHQAR